MTGSTDERPGLLHQGFVIGLLAAVGLTFLAMIGPFLVPLVLAAVFAGLLHPGYRWLATRLGGRDVPAAILLLIGALLAIVLPLAGLAGIVAAEAIHVSQQIRPWVRELMAPEGPLNRLLPDWLSYAERLEPYRDSLLEKLAEAASTAGSWLVSNVSTVTQGTLGFLLGLFVMAYAMFFFLIDGPRLIAGLKSHLPLSAADRDLVVNRGLAVTRASLKGILVIGALQGLLVGLGLWAAGLSGAAFWGTIVFVLSAIPGLGAPIVWVPAAIYLALTGSPGWAIALALWGALVVGLIDNVLRPIMVGRDAKLPDLVVLVSILGGIAFFGVVGIIVGPILAAMLDTVLGIYRRAFADALPDAE
ncbi:MAG: AI-2E family transporter [Pseudomonadales bacterium]|nr:AI-2E family transporter [Pseudomonadales bacterium]